MDGHGLTRTNKDVLANQRVLVLGLGRSGKAAARFLLKAGAKVIGIDESPKTTGSDDVAELKRTGMTVATSLPRVKADMAVVSPGISNGHPLVLALRRQSAPIVDELDLASRFVRGPIVAVTGTNGKSTTTVLIARMLASSRLRVFCGGNLAPGRPFSEALLMGRKDCYVVEASSFQLERVQWFAPHIAVILNITPDHLNRHGTMRRYAEAKFRILRRQSGEDYAVLNRDDPVVRQARLRGRAAKRFFSLKQQVNGAYLADGVLWYEGKRVMPASQIRLPGEHNIANGLAAMAAARLMGADLPAVRRTLRGFSGLPHRLEFVRRLRGVDYVNSSMTTNPVAGARTLEAVAEDKRQTDGTGQSAGVVLIAGGREKGLPTRVYTRAMQRHAKWVFLIGESGPRLARELRGRGFRSFDVSADLKQAVRAAMGKAGVGDVVLFSPGFASFDQFTDFEARGEAFRKEVGSLGHN